MAQCEQCGRALPGDGLLCPSCGPRADGPTAVRPSGATSSAPNAPSSPPQPAASTASAAGAKLAQEASSAQARTDRIAAFREELEELQRAGVVHLDSETLTAVRRHHDRVLHELSRQFDVDIGDRGKQLSLAMRLVSLVASVALAASVFFLFYRIWGTISVPVQVAILTTAPLLGLVTTDVVSARDRSRYFTTMTALLACACVVLDTLLLQLTFNQAPSAWTLLAWGAFATIVAYAYSLRMPLAFGLVAFAAFPAALLVDLFHGFWPNIPEMPESLLPSGAALLAIAVLLARRQPRGFVMVYRLCGLLCLLAPMFLLAMVGGLSRLPLGADACASVYQVLLLIACVAAIWTGVARRLREVAYCGTYFLIGLLYLKFAKVFWSVMPRWLFFLIVAASAMAIVWALNRMRRALATASEREARP
jgi:hypothetical protein